MLQKFLFFGLLLIFPLTTVSNTQAQQNSETISKQNEKKNKAVKKKAEDIEIIEGTPTRPFTKIAPIWESGHSEWGMRPNMEKTMERVKKNAAKMGADAIIEFRVSTGTASVGMGAGGGGGYLSGNASGISGSAFNSMGWGSTTNPAPVVEGWAVKWIDGNSTSPAVGMEAQTIK